MTVYADVLVVVNYIVNLLLLLLSGRLLGYLLTRRRLFLSALLGAAGSLVIFLPYVGGWFQALYKLLLLLAMTAAAFGLRPFARFFKAAMMLFAVSAAFAGALLAMQFFWRPAGLLFYNGVVYFDISALTLILCTTAAYLLLSLLERLFAGRVEESRLWEVSVSVSGRTVSFHGLADTGSSLREPFSGAPVIVCDRSLAARIRPEQAHAFRVIPCMTVTGQGMLEGFRPDRVTIRSGERRICTSDVYIASSREPISGEYQAILNPCLLDGAESKGEFGKGGN